MSKAKTRRSVLPQRPERPNDKGLMTLPMLPIRLQPEMLENVKLRALYDTAHYRVEHGGQGRVVSPADVARRILKEYFEKNSPCPDDPIGEAVRRGAA